MDWRPSRQLWCGLLCLAGAVVAVFVTGKEDVLAMAAAAVGAGLGMLCGRPTTRPDRSAVVMSLLFLLAGAAALLPAANHLPEWRSELPENIRLAVSFAAIPPYHAFWWVILAVTVVAGWFLMASPLETQPLRVFLHGGAGVIALYAVVSIVQAQTAWIYPLSGGANFGLLPNRNHTATLLVVGSIISFGLMQWEVSRGHRVGAAVSALCGAPSLAALLFFSTSRAGVVFLALGFVLWALGATGTAVKRRTALGAAGVLAVFLVVLFVVGGSTVRDRLGTLWSNVMKTEIADGQAHDVDFRQPVFRDTWRMIADAPLTGQGMGHFEFAFPHYREASLSSSRVLHPESDWLMVAAESGIPAVLVLLGLVTCYFFRCWRGRKESGGLLRWSAASAIGAALAHGAIDVPWHRPALGWFLLVVALVSLPAGAHALRWPSLWRSAQLTLGVLLIFAGGYLGWSGKTDRPPLAYRWAGYAGEMKALLATGKYDEGEFVAREAIGDFPLQYQAYYWRAAFLRMFEGTDGEMKQDVAAGRFAEPVLPRVAAEQAQVWEAVDELAEAEARAEAIRRAERIDSRVGEGNLALGQLEIALRVAQQRPGVQSALRQSIESQPLLLAHWLRYANPDLVDTFFASRASDAFALVDGLPPDLRGKVLDRWITLPSAGGAGAYMEARNGGAPGAYWRQLAEYYAKAGEKPRAVAMVAEAEGVALGGSLPDGEFARQLAALQGQGNEVAVRRLVREAVEAKDPNGEKLRVAMAVYAAAEDWEMAWRAASRLVTAGKNRQ